MGAVEGEGGLDRGGLGGGVALEALEDEGLGRWDGVARGRAEEGGGGAFVGLDGEGGEDLVHRGGGVDAFEELGGDGSEVGRGVGEAVGGALRDGWGEGFGGEDLADGEVEAEGCEDELIGGDELGEELASVGFGGEEVEAGVGGGELGGECGVALSCGGGAGGLAVGELGLEDLWGEGGEVGDPLAPCVDVARGVASGGEGFEGGEGEVTGRGGEALALGEVGDCLDGEDVGGGREGAEGVGEDGVVGWGVSEDVREGEEVVAGERGWGDCEVCGAGAWVSFDEALVEEGRGVGRRRAGRWRGVLGWCGRCGLGCAGGCCEEEGEECAGSAHRPMIVRGWW